VRGDTPAGQAGQAYDNFLLADIVDLGDTNAARAATTAVVTPRLAAGVQRRANKTRLGRPRVACSRRHCQDLLTKLSTDQPFGVLRAC